MLEKFSRRQTLCIHHKLMLETLSRRQSLCIHHKCMLEKLSRRQSLCVHHKLKLETLSRRDLLVAFATSASRKKPQTATNCSSCHKRMSETHFRWAPACAHATCARLNSSFSSLSSPKRQDTLKYATFLFSGGTGNGTTLEIKIVSGTRKPPWAGGILGRRPYRSQPLPISVHGTRVGATAHSLCRRACTALGSAPIAHRLC